MWKEKVRMNFAFAFAFIEFEASSLKLEFHVRIDRPSSTVVHHPPSSIVNLVMCVCVR
ncbi:hypothetical protein HYC85_002520 [Camellia sinensis]|uniref:Uncharacterized protein n=1 Tax=Camellia sinensis TaxID=4442 RepID=A0A7J7I9Q8_CAMSI|nr:hypothetical protein HYC85_002520 [Camellia sinensis]